MIYGLFALFALLPPFAQSAREIQSILKDSRLAEALGGVSPIREIIHVEDGYLIQTDRACLKVEIQYATAHRPGPAQYELIFHEPIELR